MAAGNADIQPPRCQTATDLSGGGVKSGERKQKKGKGERAIECPSGNYTPQGAGLKGAPLPLGLHRNSESLAGSPSHFVPLPQRQREFGSESNEF